MMNRGLAVALSLVSLPLVAFAEVKPVPPVDEILSRMVAADDARTPKLLEYSSVRKYTLENKRFGVKAGMTVKMAYHSPGPKTFEILEQSGPAPVRSKVFKRMLDTERQASSGVTREETRITPRNYDFQYLRSEVRNGRDCYVLDAVPKTTNPLLFRGQVYVDAEDFAVAHVDGSPAQNPSFWLKKTSIAQHYGKFGQFWLPVVNDSSSDVRMFGHTQVRIEYSEYHINEHQAEHPVLSGQ